MVAEAETGTRGHEPRDPGVPEAGGGGKDPPPEPVTKHGPGTLTGPAEQSGCMSVVSRCPARRPLSRSPGHQPGEPHLVRAPWAGLTPDGHRAFGAHRCSRHGAHAADEHPRPRGSGAEDTALGEGDLERESELRPRARRVLGAEVQIRPCAQRAPCPQSGEPAARQRWQEQVRAQAPQGGHQG